MALFGRGSNKFINHISRCVVLVLTSTNNRGLNLQAINLKLQTTFAILIWFYELKFSPMVSVSRCFKIAKTTFKEIRSHGWLDGWWFRQAHEHTNIFNVWPILIALNGYRINKDGCTFSTVVSKSGWILYLSDLEVYHHFQPIGGDSVCLT